VYIELKKINFKFFKGHSFNKGKLVVPDVYRIQWNQAASQLQPFEPERVQFCHLPAYLIIYQQPVFELTKYVDLRY